MGSITGGLAQCAGTDAPLRATTIASVLREAATAAPEQVALVFGSARNEERRRWTYAELLSDADSLARGLARRLLPGERLAIWAPNEPEWVISLFAAALAGLVTVPVNPAYRIGEAREILGRSGAASVLFAPQHRDNDIAGMIASLSAELPSLRLCVPFAELGALASPSTISLPEVLPSDLAQIQFTSGTTGVPKGARLHHLGLTNNARLMFGRMGVPEQAVWVNPNPMFHLGGCGLGTLGPVQVQATHVLVPSFDPALVLELLESERATVTGGVPTMMVALMEHTDFERRDLSSLRLVSSGGSTVPAALVERIERTLGVQYSTMFGQTEASPGITQTSPDDSPDDKAQTVGRPLSNTEVKIVDPVSGRTVALDTAGELCARSPFVMQGYLGMEAETAAAIDSDGWLHTGDLCTMDRRGYFRIVGRIKDMITRGGENIYPREIEDMIFAQPGVGDVAVIGVPDEHWGEQVAAFIRAAEGESPNLAELRATVRTNLAAHKVPRYWYVVSELPLTASGKIHKPTLREAWRAGVYDAGDTIAEGHRGGSMLHRGDPRG